VQNRRGEDLGSALAGQRIDELHDLQRMGDVGKRVRTFPRLAAMSLGGKSDRPVD